ncbi:unnamed protein product [Paramecium sonneborni]|uniref:YEATS domain-containing protein n=1 Tax=Paramecium sonneborni TaxID=65129 RepID=A0A8S1KPC9_9CILI|nr:unnamed protein product [Paramecium sonneborni]
MQISKSIVYGTIATWLGRKSDEKKTHSWICYVRGVNNEDLSYFIEKVIFVLHSSFENTNRVVTQHPFVISETGWGQFDIIIKIYLKGDYDQPLITVHPLKLYQNQTQNIPLTKKPVVSEQYDEIVFINPKPEILEILNSKPNQENNPVEEEIQVDQKEPDFEQMTPAQILKYNQPNFTVFDINESKATIEKAIQIVSQDILADYKRKNHQLDTEIQELQIEYENLQNKLSQAQQ